MKSAKIFAVVALATASLSLAACAHKSPPPPPPPPTVGLSKEVNFRIGRESIPPDP
jgi:hypothetical protein